MRLLPLGALIVAASALAACSSSSSSSSTPTPTPTSAAPSSAPVTEQVTTPAPISTPASTPVTTTPVATSSTARPTRTATPTASTSTPAPPPPAAPALTTTCRSLRVDVVKGGAIRGMEIAAMQFTNTGTKPCTVTGVPTATLLRNGAVVGTPSKPTGDAAQPFTVQPGEYGESLLRDYSTCNAPLSDQLRLQAPARDGVAGKTVTQPIKLRACTLRVAPVGEPS